MLTRRKFLKHLSCFYALAVAAPGALANFDEGVPVWVATDGKWVSLEKYLTGDGIDGSSTMDGSEESLMRGYDDVVLITQRRKPAKNFMKVIKSGKMGQYNGVTLHRHK
jgi:hypothetical protein